MIKAFNKWEVEAINITDPGLKNVITLIPRIVPRTGARYAGFRFHKSKTFIVERLINKLMITGHKAKKHFRSSSHFSGKKEKVYNIVEQTFNIIEEKTKKNPITVFVEALIKAAPREEIITIEYGGARYPKAVEVAPQRRIDTVLRLMTQGAYQKSFNTKISIEQALADEIISASTENLKSAAITKKRDLERQAASSK